MPFLTGLPDDIRFVLALDEGSVVGVVTGWAIAARRPALATALGCPAQRVSSYEQLLGVLDDVLPRLRGMDRPLLLDVDVEPEPEFDP